MQKYEILNVIGQGAYGTVHRCRQKQSGKMVAIKQFKESCEDELVLKTTNRQIKMHKTLRHRNIVQFKQVFKNKNGLVCLVFQFVDNNLLQILEMAQNGLPPDMVRSVVYQILHGLAFMHSKDVIHRDIKPQNILVGGKPQRVVKICDFGFARSMRRQAGYPFTQYVATRWYRPPELLVGAPYGLQIDIWAVGCVMGELSDGIPLFPGENEINQLFLIQKCLGKLNPQLYQYFLKHPPFVGIKFPEVMHIQTLEKRYVGKLSHKALSLLKGMLAMSPDQRLTALECLKHPYFDDIRNQDDMRYFQKSQEKPSRIDSAVSFNQDQIIELGDLRKEYRLPKQQLRLTNMGRREEEKQKLGQYQSKSINKTKVNFRKNKQKNISVEKHKNKQIIENTYIQFFPRDLRRRQSRENERQLKNKQINKIYTKKKSIHHQGKTMEKADSRRKVQDQKDNFFQSTGQLPLIINKDERRGHISIVLNQNNLKGPNYQ